MQLRSWDEAEKDFPLSLLLLDAICSYHQEPRKLGEFLNI